MPANARKPPNTDLELARVLLVDDDLTSRLTLKAVLEAGGYCVDSAASAAEAVGKLDERQYELVLSDLQMESPRAGLKVLAHAKLMDYKPATAILTTYQNKNKRTDADRPVLIKPEDLPGLLGKVADLISQRAARLVERQLRTEPRV
jgi:CheY-like chemotaxis protein